jgi:hypothetical protein
MNFKVIALVLVLLPACSDDNSSPYRLDDLLRLNDVQAKGTHNSYHVQPDNPIDPSHYYTHAPLDVQLEEQGVRQFELDLHLHKEEGFQVFHLPGGFDSETTCLRFTNCLKIVKNWSDHNRWHMPLVIWLEPKDEEMDAGHPDLESIVGRYDELEAEILSVWPEERILKPDDVRGEHADLPEAIAADGWPPLGELRRKVVFVMLDAETHRQRYTQDSPNLAGKLLFVDSSDPTDAYAAFFKVNNAQADFDRTQYLVSAGFVVTTNIDGVDYSSEENQARRDASLDSGAHFLSTDIPIPDSGRVYWFNLPPGGTPARCNPLSDATTCRPTDIENLP